MSALEANTMSGPSVPHAHLSRPVASIIAALFCGYLCVGLPLPVSPLFVHHKLGFSNLTVGLVIGIQFLATVLTRGNAGRLIDHHGGKCSVLEGALVCAFGGMLYFISATQDLSPWSSVAIAVVGRLPVVFAESQFVTGCVSWLIASVRPQRAGTSMSWNGIAMFAAIASGFRQVYLSGGVRALVSAGLVATTSEAKT
jgi:MFS family permease